METKTPPERKKPTGLAKRLWSRIRLRQLFYADRAAEPGKRKGTAQRKVRWRSTETKAEQRAKRVRRDRAKRAMTKAMQRRRKAKGRDVRHG